MDNPRLIDHIPARAREEAEELLDKLRANPRISVETVDGIGVFVDRALLSTGVVGTLAERRSAASKAVEETVFDGVDRTDQVAMTEAHQQALASKALGGMITDKALPLT